MQAIGSHGLKFSRFSMDTKYGFGKGGLPISVLVSDRGAEFGMPPCDETLNNDIEIGELVCLFSSIINEEIIEEISKLLLGQKKGGENCTINRSNTSDTGISNVIIESLPSLRFRHHDAILSYRIGKCLLQERQGIGFVANPRQS
jgi:hypothetical protein